MLKHVAYPKEDSWGSDGSVGKMFYFIFCSWYMNKSGRGGNVVCEDM